MIRPPAHVACPSCPYRQDAPSGLWAQAEYDRLPGFDEETAFQPPHVFMCHQQNGRLCAGWCGTHDMANNLGMRFAISAGRITPEDYDLVCDYQSPVELWETGAAAAAHGLKDLEHPGEATKRKARVLRHKQGNTFG